MKTSWSKILLSAMLWRMMAWLEDEAPRLMRALLKVVGANAEMAEAPKRAATTAVA